MMKALIIAVADFPHGLATSQRIKLMAKTLIDSGWSIEVALIHPTNQSSNNITNEIKGTHEQIPYTYLNKSSIRPQKTIAKIMDTLNGIWQSRKIIKAYGEKHNIDAIIFYTPNFLKILLALLTAKQKKIPIFFELCEIRTSTGSSIKSGLLRSLMSIGDKLTETIGYRYVNGLIVISHRIQNYYHSNGVPSNKIFYLPALVDTSDINGNKKVIATLNAKRFFLSAGSYEKKEGIKYILDAFKLVCNKDNQILLVFTGSPSAKIKADILEQAKQHDINRNLIFTGYISREELAWCYTNALALLACRTGSDFAQFGFPTKLVEYMASGTPIVATNVGTIIDYLQDGKTAFIADPERASSIANKMLEIINNNKKATAVGLNAMKLASEHFDYHRYSNSLSRFIKTS